MEPLPPTLQGACRALSTAVAKLSKARPASTHLLSVQYSALDDIVKNYGSLTAPDPVVNAIWEAAQAIDKAADEITAQYMTTTTTTTAAAAAAGPVTSPPSVALEPGTSASAATTDTRGTGRTKRPRSDPTTDFKDWLISDDTWPCKDGWDGEGWRKVLTKVVTTGADDEPNRKNMFHLKEILEQWPEKFSVAAFEDVESNNNDRHIQDIMKKLNDGNRHFRTQLTDAFGRLTVNTDFFGRLPEVIVKIFFGPRQAGTDMPAGPAVQAEPRHDNGLTSILLATRDDGELLAVPVFTYDQEEVVWPAHLDKSIFKTSTTFEASPIDFRQAFLQLFWAMDSKYWPFVRRRKNVKTQMVWSKYTDITLRSKRTFLKVSRNGVQPYKSIVCNHATVPSSAVDNLATQLHGRPGTSGRRRETPSQAASPLIDVRKGTKNALLARGVRPKPQELEFLASVVYRQWLDTQASEAPSSDDEESEDEDEDDEDEEEDEDEDEDDEGDESESS